MRKLVLGAALIGSLVLSQSALAEHRSTQFGYGHGNFNSRGFDRRFDRNFNNRFYGGRVNHHFGGYSGYNRNNFVGLSYGNGFSQRRNHRRNQGWNGGDFVGGLLVGSLLSNSYSQPRVTQQVIYRSAPIRQEVVRQEVVYVNQRQPAANTAPRRKLLRDLQGNCYQIDITPNGDEIRTELAPQECSF